MPEAVVLAAPKAAKKGSSKTIIIIAIVVVLLIGAGLAYYQFVYKPAQLKGLPTSAAGLASGAKWNNNGKVEIVP